MRTMLPPRTRRTFRCPGQTYGTALVLTTVLLATAPGLAVAHEWYSGLRSPTGEVCCNTRDCHPVATRVDRTTGLEEMLIEGIWMPVDWRKVLPQPSPDDRSHACWSSVRSSKQGPIPWVRCIILPGTS